MEVNMDKNYSNETLKATIPKQIMVNKEITEECELFQLFGQYDNK